MYTQPPDHATVGPNVTPDAKEHVTSLLANTGFTAPGLRLVDGGMETLATAYLVLATSDGSRLFIVERSDDDGESSAQLYTSPLPSAPQTRDALWRATTRITDETESIDAAMATELGVLTAVPAEPWRYDHLLADLLFGFRDVVTARAVQAS